MNKKDENLIISLPHPHPGETLLDDFMIPLGLNQRQLALKLGVAPQTISEIVNGKRSITPDTALRLELALGVSAEFWLGLQADYDLVMVREERLAMLKLEVTPV
jgi:addiction module HigA family antidote